MSPWQKSRRFSMGMDPERTRQSAPRTIDCYADTRGQAQCRSPLCRARIVWMEVVATGRKMCFDGFPKPLRTYPHPENGRRVEVMDLALNHWATCSDRNKFKRGSDRR